MTVDIINEIYDLSRSLTLKIMSWYFHKDYPNNHMQETTNQFPLIEKGPFKNKRTEWIIDSTKKIIGKLIATMIDEFGDRGIEGPPGKNVGSIDWAYKIIEAIKDFEPGFITVPPVPKCPEALVTLYKKAIIDLASYKKQIAKLDVRRKELLKKKTKTQTEIKEFIKMEHELERLFKLETKTIDQINRIKEQCPEIEEQIKQEEK